MTFLNPSINQSLGRPLRRMLELRLSDGPVVDPGHVENEARFSQLSVESQAAYVDTYVECTNEAAERYPESPERRQFSDEFLVELQIAQEAIAQDPGFALIWNDWAGCMSRLGREFGSRAQAAQSLNQSADEAANQLRRLVSSPDFEADSLAVEETIDLLSEVENELVADDIQCSEEVNLDARLRTLQHQLEQDALDANGDRWTLLLGAQDNADEENDS